MLTPSSNTYLFFLLLLAMGFLSSCGSGTKFVGDGELLYTGANVEFVNSPNVKKKKSLTADLEGLAKPSPNSKIGLGIYNTFHKPEKEGGLSNWLADRLGQEPVLFQIQDAEQSHLLMEDYLKDHGYFNSTVLFDTIVQEKEVSVTYKVNSDGQYIIRNINLPADSTPLVHLIHENQKKSVLKSGQPYQLANINAERIRLSRIANDQGYFSFDEDYLYFFVDTTVNNLETDIYLRVEEPTDSTRHQQYYMADVYVYPTYNLETEIGKFITDTVLYKDLHIIKNYDFADPPVLERSIAQDRGDLYSESRQDQTVNHLLDLGIFKFVNLKYQMFTRNDTNYLQRRIFLTPALTQDVTAEVELNTEASNSLGSAISVTYTNRNLFRGAESFRTSLSGGIETQLGSGGNATNSSSSSSSFVNTLEITGQADLIFPRFIVPFGLAEKVSSYYVPKTRFTISDNFQRRTSFFTINSFRFEYAYDWQETRYKRHSFSPLNINQVNLLSTSGEFDTLLMENPRLRASFNNTFIAGLSYQFTYSNQEINTLKDYTFFRGQLETSGNLTRLLAGTFGQNEEPYKLFGTPFSQYVRFDTDLRYNILNKKNSLVGRLLVGVGVPYGNSTIMPYIKQFFAGGANSIRAFQIRSVGPGSIPREPDTEGNVFFDRTGDIKIEANLEYRFDVFPPFLEGAVFTDAGNVWLMRDQDQDDRIPEAEFHFSRFLKEMAVGAGFGIRLDFTFVLLRLDAAVPLRNPNLPGGPAWTFDRLTPIGENIVYNLAIGYPF